MLYKVKASCPTTKLSIVYEGNKQIYNIANFLTNTIKAKL